MQQRNIRQYLCLTGKGVLMGAADVVPGVSGGTIAFITGIYEELIFSIRRFDIEALKILFKQGPVACWQHVNGNFLLALVSGILLSILSIAQVVLYLLENHPIPLWSFFFGLILASCWTVMRHIDRITLDRLLAFGFGVVVALLITSLSPAIVQPGMGMIFFSGMIAICAMILPGISGSFILLLLGMYAPVLSALRGFDLQFLMLFTTGCILGLMSFSRVLSWAFTNYRPLTLSLLGGFMLGSLNKVWPWKYTMSYTINRHGDEIPLVQDNILPAAYAELTGHDPLVWFALCLILAGGALVLLLDRK